MKCEYHPEVDAVGTCVNCKKAVCRECKVILSGETYCNPCADKLFVRIDRLPKLKTTNWFEKHLNWTVTLGVLVANIVFFALISILLIMSIELTDEALRLLAYVIGLVVLLPVVGWVLRKKNRSPYWLFLLVIPLGLILLLLLENRSGKETPSRL